MQFFSKNANLIGDTNILDLDTSVFEKSDEVIEEGVVKNKLKKNLLKKKTLKKILLLIS